MKATSVVPDSAAGVGGFSISYSGSAIGNWASGSSGNLYESLSGADSQGSFSGSGSLGLTEQYEDANDASTQFQAGVQTYPYEDAIVGNGSQEHLNLHLTSGSDGASASANYYVTFNAPACNFVHVIDTPESPVNPGNGGPFPSGADGVITEDTTGVSWSVLAQAASGVTLVGTAAYSLTAGADPVVAALLTAAGWGLSQAQPPAPIQVSFGGSGSEGHFEDDVATQVEIDKNEGPVAFSNVPRISASSNVTAEQIVASGNYDQYWDNATYTEGIWRSVFQSTYSDDTYGVHGYTGPGTSSVTWPSTAMGVDTWTPNTSQ